MSMNIRKMMGLRLPHPKPIPPPISAAEARNKALEVEAQNKENAKLEEENKIKDIFHKIYEKANNGEFELYLRDYQPLSDSIKEHLISYGYKIEEFGYTETCTIISW